MLNISWAGHLQGSGSAPATGTLALAHVSTMWTITRTGIHDADNGATPHESDPLKNKSKEKALSRQRGIQNMVKQQTTITDWHQWACREYRLALSSTDSQTVSICEVICRT